MLPPKRRISQYIEKINWNKLGIYLGAVLVVALLVAGALYLPIFNITSIEVTGIGKELSYAPVEEIRSEASGLIGQNFFKSNIQKYARQLEQYSGYVKKALVIKVFPQKVSVQIIEREPVIVLNVEEVGCAVLDADAYVLEIEETDCSKLAQKYSIPLMNPGAIKQTFQENTESSYLVVQEAARIHKVLSRLGYSVKKINLADQVLTFISHDSQKFRFSLAQDVDTQLARLVAVNDEIIQESLPIKELDLRYKRPVLTINN